MDNQVIVFTSDRNRRHLPAGIAAACRVRQSFLEKIWVTLMVVALTIAAVTAAAGDRWTDDRRAQAAPLERIITEVFVR